MMTTAAFVVWPSKLAALTALSPVTTVLWFGATALTFSTFTASSSG